MIKHIKITSEDVIRGMNDEQKHLLALKSCIEKVDVTSYIEPIANITNQTINFAIDIVNKLPKEYWKARAKLEVRGGELWVILLL